MQPKSGDPLPKFSAPPLVETVMSLQFAPIAGFTSAHVGLFASKHLGGDWVRFAEVPLIQDRIERFGESTSTQGTISLALGTQPNRIQIFHQDNERLLQIQRSRLIFNWRKRDGDYPTFEKLFPQFLGHFGAFEEFCRVAQLGDITPNQWELTYLNHIPRGGAWATPADWANVFREWAIPSVAKPVATFEAMRNATFTYEIGKQLGRLHATITHVKLPEPEAQDAIRLELLARGPLDNSAPDTLTSLFNVAHKTIVNSFADMTSQQAHKLWGRFQ